MRKAIMILGTILIAAVIIISGSAVATWVYAHWIDEDDTPDINFIDALDGDQAALGQTGPPLVLGWVILDLGSGNEMGRNQDFMVFANSPVLEFYRVYISVGSTEWVPEDGWFGNDSEDHDFTTPGTSGGSWRYIKLVGISGICDPGDPEYGPDIDAVGWDKP
jgi:hypothetical protein